MGLWQATPTASHTKSLFPDSFVFFNSPYRLQLSYLPPILRFVCKNRIFITCSFSIVRGGLLSIPLYRRIHYSDWAGWFAVDVIGLVWFEGVWLLLRCCGTEWLIDWLRGFVGVRVFFCFFLGGWGGCWIAYAMPPGRRKGGSKADNLEKLSVGDLVLAKVKGFPAWPAKVSVWWMCLYSNYDSW